MKHEELIERLRFFRRANERAEREEFEERIFDTLARKGYVVPRRRRRWLW
ncbi:MAG: hypothetical protein ACHQ4J_05040 [Candidatus Binatia bacterium]